MLENRNLEKRKVAEILVVLLLGIFFIGPIYAESDCVLSFKIPEFWNEEKGYCFFSQETNISCVPASIQMVLGSYDFSPLPTQAELAVEMKTDINHTTEWKYT